MEVTCPVCDSGTGSDGNPCTLCGGDGVVDLTDSDFVHYGNHWQLHGYVWNAMLTYLSDIEDKVDDIKEKVDEIKDVVDEL